MEAGVNLNDLLKLTTQYLGYQTKLYGPQEDELKDNADPIRFAAQMKMRREAAAQVAASASTMAAKDLKTILQERGYRDKGTLGELANRVTRVLNRAEQHVGFGEMSAFGDKVARSIFARIDEDNDKALSYVEAVGLARKLR